MTEVHFRCSTLGLAPGLTHKHYTRPAILARDKHSSLLRKSVNYGRKKFYSIGPRMKMAFISKVAMAIPVAAADPASPMKCSSADFLIFFGK